MTAEDFKTEFHSKTLAYQPAFRLDDRPVVVVVGDQSHNAPGHALAVSLINLLARAHQHVLVVGDLDRPLLCRDVFGLGTLAGGTVGLSRIINPTIIANSATQVASERVLSIGIGVSGAGVDLSLGCDGWLALAGDRAEVVERAASVWGAFLAACLGANAAFHRLLGDETLPSGTYSLWARCAQTSTQGPDFAGPLAVGNLLQVGAGGVGAALDYWLAYPGVNGRWGIVDGDRIEVPNLNRQLCFVAADAGYPKPPAAYKAERAGQLLRVGYDARWFHHAEETTQGRYDLILPLANEHGVRAAIQARQQPVLLHATTSPRWSAQMHRHVAGVDDCINCRLPDTAAHLACSTARVDEETTSDAAVPALSGLAGLLLATELVRLQRGELMETTSNHHSVLLETAAPFAAPGVRHSCGDGCRGWSPAEIRNAIPVGDRYASLDPGRRGKNSA